MKDKYIRQTLKKMNVPFVKKKDIARDLEEIFASAAEHGESEEEVIARLGTPQEYAAGFSGQFGVGRSKGRIVCIVLTAVVSLGAFFLSLLTKTASVQASLGDHASVGVIGGADGPTSIWVTSAQRDPSAVFLWVGILALALTGVQLALMLRRK